MRSLFLVAVLIGFGGLAVLDLVAGNISTGAAALLLGVANGLLLVGST